MNGSPEGGPRVRLLLVVGVVLLVGLSGCLDSAGVGDTDDVLYPNGGASASASPATDGTTGASGGTDDGSDLDVLAGQASPNGTTAGTSTPTEAPPDTPTPGTEDGADADDDGSGDDGAGGGSSVGGGGGGGGASSSNGDGSAGATQPTTQSGAAGSASTFVIAATTDAELTYEFTVDGDVEKTKAADGTAADADDQVTENDDGTTTVVGSTGGNAGDAYLVDGEITSFEKTGGEGGFELYLDDEDVTDELSGATDGGDGGSAGGGGGDGATGGADDGGSDGDDDDGSGDGASDEETYTDSDYDILHTRSIESNGDGTTTISGEVWNQYDGSIDGLAMVVEVYDDGGNWLASEWVELDPVTPERQSWSVTFDVPRDEIGDFRADVNGIQPHDGDEHYNAPGQCVEIDGDGPSDEEPESGGTDVVEYDDGTVVVGEVYNGADEHDMAFVRVFVSVYDDSGDRLATRSTLMEDLPQGEFGRFAVAFDETDVADVRVDADELAIRDGELVCRPPL